MTLEHRFSRSNGIDIHYVRQGSGLPLILLHGWPEFWRAWRKIIGPLSETFDVVAPDLRGFGQSSKPPVPALEGYRVEDHAADLGGLADALGFERFGLVSHDVGAYVAQTFVRMHPERVVGLFFFDCPYPGIGTRWGEPDQLREVWYQWFHQLPVAAEVVGAGRDATERYVRHFLSHWAHDPDAFDEDDIAAWVDNFSAPGNVQGGFNWYVASGPGRLELIHHGAPKLPLIGVPTRVRWGASDPILKVGWADRLGEYFADCDFAPVEEAGHFVAYERPDVAVAEITDFFGRLST